MEGSDKSCDKPLVPKHGGKFGRLRRASRTKNRRFHGNKRPVSTQVDV